MEIRFSFLNLKSCQFSPFLLEKSKSVAYKASGGAVPGCAMPRLISLPTLLSVDCPLPQQWSSGIVNISVEQLMLVLMILKYKELK